MIKIYIHFVEGSLVFKSSLSIAFCNTLSGKTQER